MKTYAFDRIMHETLRWQRSFDSQARSRQMVAGAFCDRSLVTFSTAKLIFGSRVSEFPKRFIKSCFDQADFALEGSKRHSAYEHESAPDEVFITPARSAVADTFDGIQAPVASSGAF